MINIKKAGFTMIELLIVIAVLGILAVAVLSAINPIEQINRSRDTGSRSDAEQLISASDRFYANKGYYPWMTNPTDPNFNALNSLANGNMDSNTPGADNAANVLYALEVTSGEVKSSFIQRIIAADYNRLFMYNRGNQGDSTYVCFVPQSNAFASEAWARCGSNAAGNGAADNIPADLEPIVDEVCLTATTSYSCLP